MAIQILSDELISQIAAGEVIERPASALKELLENSLDAGAHQISVELEEGGLKLLRVVDDGAGIPFEELPLAFTRHATSKIHSVEDLFEIRSLGFRGEALASMASIAEVELSSLSRQEELGGRIEVDGGKLLRHEPASCPAGTDIRVRGLFKHTPARKKYMKTERTEYQKCFDYLCRIALSHPKVGFRLKRDGQVVFDLPRGQTLPSRIRGLYGGDVERGLLPVQYHQSNLQIRGFVGKPELSRSSRKYQFIFVNGRFIESRVIQSAVNEAFHSLLMHGKHPWFLLDIEMDPEFLDVNVHPRKLELRFLNQQELFRAVRGAAKHALEKTDTLPLHERPRIISNSSPWSGPVVAPASEAALPLNFERVEREHQSLVTLKGEALRPVAQVANSYIVAEGESGLVLIDQHAAHERVRYAELMKALESRSVEKQALLTPLELDLGREGAEFLGQHLEAFEALGFELEAFGADRFLLRSVPSGLDRREPEDLFKDVLTDLEAQGYSNAVKNLQEHLLTYTACRGAIKFGDPLSLHEMQALLLQMERTEHCDHCPHGRPAMIQFSFDELETLFKRKNF